MLPIYLDLTNARALGDAICATPTIKKLYESYERKINVISQYPEIFKNNPYVDRNYLSNAINIDYIKENYIYHNSFHHIGKKNEFGVELKHNNIDIRQFHSIMLGFMLSPYEMECYYKPDEFKPIDNLPEKYVLIHPVQTWPSRTWSPENWMLLTKMLNEKGIHVVNVTEGQGLLGGLLFREEIWTLKKDLTNPVAGKRLLKFVVQGRTDFLGSNQPAEAMTKNGSKKQRNRNSNQFGFSFNYTKNITYAVPDFINKIKVD
jgi:ADP-heptose:LPS heptosyltransferase